MATLGVATGILGFVIPGAAVFTTPAAWTLIGGSLGNAMGIAIPKALLGVLDARGIAPPPAPANVERKP